MLSDEAKQYALWMFVKERFFSVLKKRALQLAWRDLKVKADGG